MDRTRDQQYSVGTLLPIWEWGYEVDLWFDEITQESPQSTLLNGWKQVGYQDHFFESSLFESNLSDPV